MTALYIKEAILLLLLLIAMLRVKITVSYTTAVAVHVRILFLRFPLYPQKKKVSVKRYRYKAYQKRLLKQRKKEREKAKNKQPVAKKKKARPPLKASLRLYTYLFRSLYKRFLHYFRIDIAKLHITVATGDAAQTAILTGVASQFVAYVLEILQNHANFRSSYRTDISVTPDFLGEKSTAECDITFSMRVLEILDLGIRFFYHFLTKRFTQSKQPKNKEEKPWQTAN